MRSPALDGRGVADGDEKVAASMAALNCLWSAPASEVLAIVRFTIFAHIAVPRLPIDHRHPRPLTLLGRTAGLA